MQVLSALLPCLLGVNFSPSLFCLGFDFSFPSRVLLQPDTMFQCFATVKPRLASKCSLIHYMPETPLGTNIFVFTEISDYSD